MDSINKNQPEDNYKPLTDSEAKKKIKELTGKASSCFFCTNIQTGQAFETRPMALQEMDDEGNLWFLSAKDSNKNSQLQKDPKVQLLFQGAQHSDFLEIYGDATITDDKEKIKQLWNPMYKVWFTEGIDDPRISVIKVTPIEGYYWDTVHGQTVALLKRIVGAISGKTIDDSVEGTIKV